MKKSIIIGLLGSVTAITGILALIGTYFVRYGIKRRKKPKHDHRAPTSTVSEQESAHIKRQRELYHEWLPTIETEEVTLTSRDGLTLWGLQYLVNPQSDRWVLGVHGYKSHHKEYCDIAYAFGIKDYNMITPDLRGHGNSEGNYMTMGYWDSKDLLLWIDYILSLNPNAQIVLHGISMGAATVMMTAGEKLLPNNVIAVIEDCGYTNARQMVIEQLDYRFKLPAFPFIQAAQLMARLQTGADYLSACPLKAIEYATVPILFIHGDADGYVRPYMVEQLYNAYQGEKKLLIVEGADHACSRNVAPALYYQTVFEFLSRVK